MLSGCRRIEKASQDGVGSHAVPVTANGLERRRNVISCHFSRHLLAALSRRSRLRCPLFVMRSCQHKGEASRRRFPLDSLGTSPVCASTACLYQSCRASTVDLPSHHVMLRKAIFLLKIRPFLIFACSRQVMC